MGDTIISVVWMAVCLDGRLMKGWKMSEQIAQRVVETPVETPTSPPDKLSDIKTTTYEHTEKPASLHEVPLINEILEINDDHFNIPEDTKYLNEFILSEIKRQDLEDTKESYKIILDNLVKKTNIPDGLDIYAKLERLSEYAKIQQKLYDVAKEREEFLAKDPNDMTSRELKKYIEGK